MKPLLFSILLVLLVGFGCKTTEPFKASPETTAMFDSCLVCHSTREMQRGPILNGLQPWYAKSQMEKFNHGIRGSNEENKSERLMVTGLSKVPTSAEIAELAKLIGTLDPVSHKKVVQGDLASGEAQYVRCKSCHGDKAEGKKFLKAPQLAYLEDWYMLDQLRKYKNGLRGYHPKDTHGKTMAAGLADMSDQKLKDVTAYIVDAFGVKSE